MHVNGTISLQKPFINDEMMLSFNSCVYPINEFTC